MFSVLSGPNAKTIFLANQEAYTHIAHVTRDLAPNMNPFANTPSFNSPPTRSKNPKWAPQCARGWMSVGLSLLATVFLFWILNRIGIP